MNAKEIQERILRNENAIAKLESRTDLDSWEQARKITWHQGRKLYWLHKRRLLKI